MISNPFIPGLTTEHSDKSSESGSLILDGNSTRSKNSRFEKMRNSLRNTLFQPEKSRSLSTMSTSNLNTYNDDEKSAYTPTSDTHDNHDTASSFGLYFTERNRGPKRSSMFCPDTRNMLSLDRLSETGEERHSYSYKGDNFSIVITPTERGNGLEDNPESTGFGSLCDRDIPSVFRRVEEAKNQDSLSLENGTFENRSMHSAGSPCASDKRSSIFLRDIESEIEDIKRELKIENDPHIHFIKGNFYDEYIEKKVLGEGTSGIVKKVIKKDTDQAFAVKVVHYRDDLEMIYLIVKEFKNQQKLNNKNIIQVYDLYIDYFKKKIYTVMELAECREMFDVLKDLGHYSEAVASGIFKQILTSISYLHSNGVCHRDLKPNNILVSEDGKRLKIADFNVSKFSDNKKEKFSYMTTHNHKMWTYTGTIAFTAPEVFNESEYTEAVDMWSAGVVLYTMLCGYQPFQAEYVSDLIEQIKAGKFEFPSDPWDNISKQAKNLVKHLIDANPKTRYSPAQALMHPWIANNGIVSNTNIPRTQFFFRRNCRRNAVRTNTYCAPVNRSGKKIHDLHGHHRRAHHHTRIDKDLHKEHKINHLLNMRENILNRISETSEGDHHEHTIHALHPKRGKTGPEGPGIQSFHAVFPVKMERSFSFSALEDDEKDLESDEDDHHHVHKDIHLLHAHDLKRPQSHLITNPGPHEDILKDFIMPNVDREKLSPLIVKERNDKENIEPESHLQDKINSVKLAGTELNKENKEEKIVLGNNKFCNEPSKAQE